MTSPSLTFIDGTTKPKSVWFQPVNDTVYGVLADGSGNAPTTKAQLQANLGYALDAGVVHTTGPETVAGVKTFSASPVVPDATTAQQAPAFHQIADAVMSVLTPGTNSLKTTTTGTSSVCTLTATYAIVVGTGIGYRVSNVAVSIDISTSGAGGLDTGTVAASTIYFKWLIYNPTTSTVAGLYSLSSTAPVMPAGYTCKALVGMDITDGTGNEYLLNSVQYGNVWTLKVGGNVSGYPALITGVAGAVGDVGVPTAPTWVAASLTPWVPSIASQVKVFLTSSGGTGAMTAPSAAYGAYNSQTNPPPLVQAIGGVSRSAETANITLETTASLQYASNGAANGLYLTAVILNL